MFYIDDVIGIWLIDPVQDCKLWDLFFKDMNSWHGMEWECNFPSISIDFMDLTITINHGRLVTTPFEKDLNLDLYIPPF